MSMRFFFALLCACAIALSLMSCEHRPLETPLNARYVRVYIDEDIKNVTCGFYNEAYELSGNNPSCVWKQYKDYFFEKLWDKFSPINPYFIILFLF